MGATMDGTDLSVTDALEIARDSPEGAEDPTVSSVLDAAVTEIWEKIKAEPTSYVMSRDEFAVFNYFQSRFDGDELTSPAIRRYWDHQERANGA